MNENFIREMADGIIAVCEQYEKDACEGSLRFDVFIDDDSNKFEVDGKTYLVLGRGSFNGYYDRLSGEAWGTQCWHEIFIIRGINYFDIRSIMVYDYENDDFYDLENATIYAIQQCINYKLEKQ